MARQFTFSQAITGFNLYARGSDKSHHTLETYQYTISKFQTWLETTDLLSEDPLLEEITHNHIYAFLAEQTNLTRASKAKHHCNLSAFWHWANDEGIAENIMKRVECPEPEDREIDPLSKSDVEALFKFADKSKLYHRRGKKPSQNTQPNALRNKLIMLILLDTGIRVNELVTLKISDVDTRNQRITVFGKGAKERPVPFSARVGQHLWRYLSTERADAKMNDRLFMGTRGEMTRSGIQRFLSRLGERAGVTNVHPHRFRHTFAIQYLRNGGDIYTLQEILGHSTLDMCKKYLQLAQADIDNAHRRASPVDNWRL